MPIPLAPEIRQRIDEALGARFALETVAAVSAERVRERLGVPSDDLEVSDERDRGRVESRIPRGEACHVVSLGNGELVERNAAS